MDDKTRRFGRQATDESDAIELNDVLEPYDELPAYDREPEAEPYSEEPYDDAAYDDAAYDDDYEDDYSDYHEAVDEAGRFKVALGVFDTVSILVGVVVILVLVAMLASLATWLRSDIMHSALLLQSGLQ